MMRFAIDLPNPHDPGDAWVNYDYYTTRDEAIQAARHHFGADEEGRIQLVSELPVDEIEEAEILADQKYHADKDEGQQ